MRLATVKYLIQATQWPQAGQYIIGQFDDRSVVVYQAYCPSIGHFAARNGYFGGGFSFNRMSWIKTNFLWMMFRSGWGTKEGQEVTLAVRITRTAFDLILGLAVHSSFQPVLYSDEAAWERAVSTSPVRLQWDPDHDPSGTKAQRRAIQLGLRGDVLARYAREWVLEIEDISEFVAPQRRNAESGDGYARLVTPKESVYQVADQEVARRLGLSAFKHEADEDN